MSKLTHIASGWFHYIQGTPQTRKRMERRLAVCEDCPHKKLLGTVGQTIVNLVPENPSVYLCSKCSCPLSAKTADPSSSCPENRWAAEPSSYY